MHQGQAFVDGQNRGPRLPARRSDTPTPTSPDGYTAALAKQVCARLGWELAQVRFYTGIPDVGANPKWHSFWTHKLAAMGRGGAGRVQQIPPITATAIGWIYPMGRNTTF